MKDLPSLSYLATNFLPKKQVDTHIARDSLIFNCKKHLVLKYPEKTL